jgi:hypothetical protein
MSIPQATDNAKRFSPQPPFRREVKAERFLHLIRRLKSAKRF